jgi:hypothetical protein
VDPVPDSLLLRKSGRSGTSGSVARNSDQAGPSICGVEFSYRAVDVFVGFEVRICCCCIQATISGYKSIYIVYRETAVHVQALPFEHSDLWLKKETLQRWYNGVVVLVREGFSD